MKIASKQALTCKSVIFTAVDGAKQKIIFDVDSLV